MFAACSLALCLCGAVLWARSMAVMDQVRSADATHQTTFVSANGELVIQKVTVMIPDLEPGLSIAHALPSQYRPSLSWQVAGFGSGHDLFPTLDGPIQTDTVQFPLWLVVIVLAAPPVLLWGRRGGLASPQPVPCEPSMA